MYKSVWNKFNSSVCSLNFYNRKGILFFKSSGFRYEDFIISSYCPEEISKADKIIIEFNNGETENRPAHLCLPVGEFSRRISSGSAMNLNGLLALEIMPDDPVAVPPVYYGNSSAYDIGTSIAILSYSCRSVRPYLKTGVISSRNTVNGTDLLLVESSFEQGNSGSPVIDIFTGEVIGVIVECFSSPGLKHKDLKFLIDENIRILNSAVGKWTLGNIDPAQVLKSNQFLMKHLAKEIYISTQRTYGYAVPFRRVWRFLKGSGHNRQIATG